MIIAIAFSLLLLLLLCIVILIVFFSSSPFFLLSSASWIGPSSLGVVEDISFVCASLYGGAEIGDSIIEVPKRKCRRRNLDRK